MVVPFLLLSAVGRSQRSSSQKQVKGSVWFFHIRERLEHQQVRGEGILVWLFKPVFCSNTWKKINVWKIQTSWPFNCGLRKLPLQFFMEASRKNRKPRPDISNVREQKNGSFFSFSPHFLGTSFRPRYITMKEKKTNPIAFPTPWQLVFKADKTLCCNLTYKSKT